MPPLLTDPARPRESVSGLLSNFAEILLPALVLAAAFAAVYAGVLARLVHNWAVDENYSHGFLVVPVALYLVWERRARLAAAPARPAAAGLVIVIASLIVLAAGVLGAELFLARLSMLGVVAGTVLFVFGWRHLAIVAFPLAFLLLMIPIPAIVFNQIALPLQLLASRLGEAVLMLAGVPVLREGNVIALAHARLEVAEACSGIRSLASLLALAIVYGYFSDSRAWVRVTLAVVAIPVAIVVNGLRVAGTGLLAQRFGAEAAQGFLHAFSGWLMFLAAFALLVAVHRAIAYAVPNRRASGAGSIDPPGRPSRLPARRTLTRIAVVACCLFAAAAVIHAATRTERVPPRTALERMPMRIDQWDGRPGAPLDADAVAMLGVNDLLNRVYSSSTLGPVALYIGYYDSQREGDTIHSPLNCLPGAGWEPVERTRLAIPVRDAAGAASPARSIVVNRLVIQQGAARDLVLYWYQSHGRVVASEYWGRLWLAVDAVRLNRTDGALVRVIVPIAGNAAAPEAASQRAATAFVQALFPLLGRYLPE